MRTGKNLKKEYSLFLFQLKSIRGLAIVPLIIIFVLIPLILILTMKKYDDIVYVEERFIILSQYFIPIFSIWWIGFSFIDLIEGDGNEVYYINHRMKHRLVFIWFALYMAVIGAGYLIASIWIENMALEYVRIAISCCFYVGIMYSFMYIFSSMTAAFLGVAIYWTESLFGSGINMGVLNCYVGLFATKEMIIQHYSWIMLAAVILYVAGCICNMRKRRFV